MSSKFLIAVPHELPQQDNLVNKGKEGKMFDADYVNNHLEQKLSLGVPEFSCIRNFPFNKNMNLCDIAAPNHTAAKRHTLYEELNMSPPKLIKLQPELTNYHSGAAVDMVDVVRSRVIKNDVILGKILEKPYINKNEKTDAILEETSLHQLADETLDSCNSNHISVAAIGCGSIKDISCSDRKPSDHQGFTKMETDSAILKIQDENGSCTSLGTGQDGVTETENLLLNSEKPVFFAHEFAGSDTDEYHSVHDSFSLSEFLICPTSFEQKVNCDSLLHPVQKEEVGGSSSATAAVDVSTGAERMDAHVMFQCESEISGFANSSFSLDNKSDGNNVVDSTAHPLCETQKLSHSAEEGTNLNLLQNKMPDSMGMTLSQTVVKDELLIKQEVEEDPMLNTIQVPSIDLLHNRDLDFVDDALFQNWFMSLVNQETVTENISTSTYDHHESSATVHSEVAKEYSVEPHTKIENKIVDRDLALPDLIGESGNVQVADHYAESVQNCNEGNVSQRFLQNLFPAVADTPSTKKTEESSEKVKNAHQELLLPGLSTPASPKSAVTQIPSTNVQSLENKPDFAATLEPNVDNNAKPESDNIHKHHKKELLKKFSSGLLNDGKCSQGNIIQTEIAMKDSDLPSTSAAVTNEKKCIKDCIVISDSDDDSIIEFDIVKTCTTKKRYTKSALSGAPGKNIQSNSRKCSRNTKSSTNEDALGQQARNSTVKNSVIQECIVLSDSDDESAKPPPPSNRAEEAVNISVAESHVCDRDGSPRNRNESHGVIDLSGGRSPSALSKSNSALPPASDSNVGVFATAFAASDSQCSLAERLGARNSGLVTNNSNTFTHIVAATITYNTAQSSFEGESNGGDVIDLSRRNLTPLTASWQNNKTNSALDVLDLSGSEKKQLERHSVIKSVGSATENKSTTKDITEDKDSSPAWSCPICFESLLSGQSVSSTPCGHVFCTKCIEEAVNQFKKCPTCCRRVALKRVHKIFL